MKTLDQMSLADLRRWRPEKVDMAVIGEIARKIAETVPAQRIVLFGSYATGTAEDESDVDLLVIAESSEPPTKRSVPIYHLLRNYLVPIDVIVRTPAEVDRSAQLPFSFIQTALREGVTLYER